MIEKSEIDQEIEVDHEIEGIEIEIERERDQERVVSGPYRHEQAMLPAVKLV
jgi:hypothetical protein